MHLRNDFKVIMAEKIMTVPIMSLDCLKCHVEYVIFYYGGKFLDVVREHFISSQCTVVENDQKSLISILPFSI